MDPNHPFHGAPNKGTYPSQPPHPTQPQRAPPQSQYATSYGHSASSGGGTPDQWGYSASSTPQVSNVPSHVQGVVHQTGPAPHGAPQPHPSAAPAANSNYYGSTREGWEAQRQREQQNQQQQQQQQQWQQQQQQQWQQQQQLSHQQRPQQQQHWQQQQRQQLEQQRDQPHYFHPTATMGPQALVPPGNSNSNWGNAAGGSLAVGSPGVVHQPQGPPNPPVGGRVRCPRCGTTYPSGRACPSCGYR